MNVLQEIVEHKKQELRQRQKDVPVAVLEENIKTRGLTRNFRDVLRNFPYVQIIAEVKKASPSRGVLCTDFNPTKLASTYARNGACAISVLTESKYFQGDIDYLPAVKKAVSVPVFRKDFIFTPYQIIESAAYGADALLLVASILDDKQLVELIKLSEYYGMHCLVETHDEIEVNRALNAGANIIGINNRNLGDFSVDINTTLRLRHLVPADCIIISESGIQTRNDMLRLKKFGINAVLIGEKLITSTDIGATMRELSV